MNNVLVPTEPRAVVEGFLTDVLNGARPDAADDLVADPPLRQRVRLFREAFPDLEVKANLLVVDGDLVAVNLRGRGTHRGPLHGIVPTGRSWAATCSAFYRVEDGRIVDHWVNWDLLGILEQLGAVNWVGTSMLGQREEAR